MVWVRIGSLSAGIWVPLGNVMHLIAPVEISTCWFYVFCFDRMSELPLLDVLRAEHVCMRANGLMRFCRTVWFAV